MIGPELIAGTGGALLSLTMSGTAKAFLEKISDAIGVVYEPTRIKRAAIATAVAEIEVAKMKAVAGRELNDQETRGIERLAWERVRIEANVEAIVEQAVLDLDQEATPAGMENDWISEFFNRCRLISDQEMQSLWGKILAGEANAPGAFSRKTLEVVALLSKDDAASFTSLIGCAWRIGVGGRLAPLIFEKYDRPHLLSGIDGNKVDRLQDLGLVALANGATFIQPIVGNAFCIVGYFDKTYIVRHRGAGFSLPIGSARLTLPGRELAAICGAKPIEGFPEFVINKWSESGVLVVSPMPKARLNAKGLVTFPETSGDMPCCVVDTDPLP